jgi:hypothetical protein
MSPLSSGIVTVGIDIGKNSFHVVGQDERGAIVLRQKWSRGQLEARLANLPACMIGIFQPARLGLVGPGAGDPEGHARAAGQGCHVRRRGRGGRRSWPDGLRLAGRGSL